MFARIAQRLPIIAAIIALPAALGAQSVAASVGAADGVVAVIDPSTTYYACYVPGSGTVYRIKAANTPAACTKSTHVEFSWSPPTTPGWSKVSRVQSQQVFLPVNFTETARVACPAGTTLISGGYMFDSLDPTAPPPLVTFTGLGSFDQQWHVAMTNYQQGAKTAKFRATALCAE